MVPGGRKPKTRGSVPGDDRRPRRSGAEGSPPLDREQLHPTWSFKYLDAEYEGEWDWRLSKDEMDKFHKFLKEIEGNTWSEIRKQQYNNRHHSRQKHHEMPASELVRAAQDRLAEIGLGDIEEMFRFRLGGTVRLWGVFLTGQPEFYVVWWDRKHRVFPTD